MISLNKELLFCLEWQLARLMLQNALIKSVTQSTDRDCRVSMETTNVEMRLTGDLREDVLNMFNAGLKEPDSAHQPVNIGPFIGCYIYSIANVRGKKGLTDITAYCESVDMVLWDKLRPQYEALIESIDDREVFGC